MQLNKYDLHWCVRRLPHALRETLKEENIVVAGGYIRACILNEPINDVDVFIRSKEEGSRIAMVMVGDDKKRLITTDNAITIKGMKYPVQFITRWTYDNPQDILKSFDFSICQAAFWWEKHPDILTAPEDDVPGKWCSTVSESFYQDLAAKRLIYLQPSREEEPGGSMLRVLKYYQKGYRITIDSFAAVMARLANGVNFGGMMVQEEGKLDVPQFHKVIRGLLHEVDPNIDPDNIIEDVRNNNEEGGENNEV